MTGDDDLLISAVNDFCTKVVDNLSIGIERDGLGRDLVKKIADQGFLALRLSVDKGGAGVSESAYHNMLREFSVHSPSVAVLVMTVNSVLIPVLQESENQDILAKVISGEMIPSIPLNADGLTGMPVYSLRKEGEKIAGDIPYVMGFGWPSVLAGTDSTENGTVLITGGAKKVHEHSKLGLRGLDLHGISVDSTEYSVISRKNGKEELSRLFENICLETASIALGIAEGALAKAVEYAKVRSTFEHLLKDYQPVAFPLTRLLGEKEMLARYLFHKDSFTEVEKLYAKTVAVTLAKNASRQSIQTHGGYGYLEDFGVEKYYRDSMALSVLFGNRIAEQKRLSDLIFESESGFI